MEPGFIFQGDLVRRNRLSAWMHQKKDVGVSLSVMLSLQCWRGVF